MVDDDDPTPRTHKRKDVWQAERERRRLVVPPPPPVPREARPSVVLVQLEAQLHLACARVAELERRATAQERVVTLIITSLVFLAAEKVRLLSWLAEVLR